MARRAFIVFAYRLTPVRWSSEYSSMDAWPIESTKRSRFGHIGILGIKAKKLLPQTVSHGRHRHRSAWVA